jgi:hypothetical protein
MGALNELLQTLPEEAKDLRLNLQSLLADGALSREQRLGTALACAYAVRAPSTVLDTVPNTVPGSRPPGRATHARRRR